jgi:hypothetical protein
MSATMAFVPASGAEGRREASLRAALRLAVLVFVGAAVAAAIGYFSTEPRGPETAVGMWGAEVRLDGRGAYRRDSASGALQVRANDLVTMLAALPLLGVSLFLARRGSRGGRLLLAGALGYFLYTYASLAFGLVYNELFLLYVALFAASLLGFAFALLSLDVDAFAAGSARYPRRSGALFSLAVSLFLGMAWIGGRVLPARDPAVAARILETYHTLYIQVLDLGLVAPAGLLAAWWLARRDARGYVLGAVLFVKGATLGLAVTTMGFSQLAAGEDLPLPLLAGFGLLTAAALVLAFLALRSAGLATAREGRKGEAA